jgi:hypothetical protein
MSGSLYDIVILHDVKLNYAQLICMKILCNSVQQSVVYHEYFMFQFSRDDDKSCQNM